MNLIDKAKSENLSAGGKFSIQDVPMKKFYEHAQYIENVLLPAIERKSGKESQEYKLFTSVSRSLLYAVMIVDRDRALSLKLQQIVQINKILQVRVDIAERELLKYTTIEDLYLTEAMDHIATGVRNRVEDLLNKKP